jgi:hypothetical protein
MKHFFRHAITNWRTTLMGVAMVLGAVSDFLTQLTSWQWDTNRLIADWTAFAGGIGLICAKDMWIS